MGYTETFPDTCSSLPCCFINDTKIVPIVLLDISPRKANELVHGAPCVILDLDPPTPNEGSICASLSPHLQLLVQACPSCSRTCCCGQCSDGQEYGSVVGWVALSASHIHLKCVFGRGGSGQKPRVDQGSMEPNRLGDRDFCTRIGGQQCKNPSRPAKMPLAHPLVVVTQGRLNLENSGRSTIVGHFTRGVATG